MVVRRVLFLGVRAHPPSATHARVHPQLVARTCHAGTDFALAPSKNAFLLAVSTFPTLSTDPGPCWRRRQDLLDALSNSVLALIPTGFLMLIRPLDLTINLIRVVCHIRAHNPLTPFLEPFHTVYFEDFVGSIF